MAVMLFNFNRLLKVSCRESPGMPEAIAGFIDIFGNKVFRRVAVIAIGDGVVAAFGPSSILIPHHMTIYAGLGFIGKIRIPCGIIKCISGQPQRCTD